MPSKEKDRERERETVFLNKLKKKFHLVHSLNYDLAGPRRDDLTPIHHHHLMAETRERDHLVVLFTRYLNGVVVEKLIESNGIF